MTTVDFLPLWVQHIQLMSFVASYTFNTIILAWSFLYRLAIIDKYVFKSFWTAVAEKSINCTMRSTRKKLQAFQNNSSCVCIYFVCPFLIHQNSYIKKSISKGNFPILISNLFNKLIEEFRGVEKNLYTLLINRNRWYHYFGCKKLEMSYTID